MTTQIILGNGHGIAVASDSAVTLGGRRTFDTSEKIYPLPLPHAVAVLHAGNVVFHGMPYSTIISSWIQSIGGHQLRYLQDYVESFSRFLCEEIHGWCDEEQQRDDFIESMNGEFQRIWNRMFVERTVVSSDEALKIWQSEVEWITKDDNYTFDAKKIEVNFLLVWHKQTEGSRSVSESVEYWFDDVPRTPEINDLIEKYVYKSLEGHYPLSDRSSAELTFAGFGTHSLIPAYQTLKMHGALNGSIVWDKDDAEYAVRHSHGFCLINVIGQNQAIVTFLQGYDPALRRVIHSASSGAFEKKIETESTEHERSGEHLPQLDPSIQNKMGELIEGAFADFGEKTRLISFRSTVVAMPLASLATTAKSLVQIQELFLDSRGELPTVGGQVRVATITKSHGFKWVTAMERQ